MSETQQTEVPAESTGAIDISGDGGVLKQILREGTGPLPPQKSNVRVHYVGTLDNGEIFDSSRDRGETFTFHLGGSEVIKAWDAGVATMRQGEKSILTCRHDYAYGEEGSPPKIPPKSTLKFEVELFGWDDPEPDTIQEKILAANKRKDEGNDKFKESQYKEACELYNKAIDYFKNSWSLTDDEKKEVDGIKLPCLLNLAACQLKTKDYSDAILSCSKALDIDTHNVKALYRRAQAYSRSADWENAKADLLEGIKLAPNNKDLRTELDLLKKATMEYKDKQKKMFAGLFDKMSKADEKKEDQKTSAESKSNESAN